MILRLEYLLENSRFDKNSFFEASWNVSRND